MGLLAAPLLISLSLAIHCAAALTVDVTPVHRLADPPSRHESLEQHWTVAASSSNDQIQQLSIDALCQVYVSYAPQETANDTLPLLMTVSVTGSDFKLITGVDVAVSPSQGVQIRLQDASHLQQIDGLVRVQVTLHRQYKLHSLQVHGDGDVVVQQNVLVEHEPTADVRVATSGAGSVHLPPSWSLTVNSISLTTDGSGGIFLPGARALDATTVSLTQSGSGAIAVTSDAMDATRNISVTASGAGGVCLDTSHLETNVMRLKNTGSGDVYVGHAGSSDAADFYQSGSGSTDLGSIHCVDVDVQLYGSGNVTVASARSVSGHDFGLGKILYAGETPNDILPQDPWAYNKIPIAEPAASYHSRTCVVPAAPLRALTRLGEGASVTHALVTPARVGFLVLFAACFGVAYLFENRRQRRARRAERGERTPLLADRVTPTYV